MPHPADGIRAQLQAQAEALGFLALRVAEVPPGEAPRAQEFAAWLEAGHAGELGYLERGAAIRRDPRLKLPQARSALVLALDHGTRRPPDPGGLTGRVARYAWGRDYHNHLLRRLRKLQSTLLRQGVQTWGGVDAQPILERAWAERAGLGFNGRNCMQILPARGSYFFLAVLFTDLALQPDPPIGEHCGRCTRCLPACPTGAFVQAHVLDARRCISYWTIEARGPIPAELRPGLGRWVFGCDVCQEVCPHNAAPPDEALEAFAPVNAWLDLEELLLGSDEHLQARFHGSPIHRPGPEGLRRNASVVLGNIASIEAVDLLRRAEGRASALVAEHIRWALARAGA